ncbi:MAG: CPBP family intramembrane metalloprotease [candidate division Zixibacteria bacterium]|nr:CPBP family intramembrane metalloprotease [candidate division Zixibacteria bacterium]
MLDRFRKFVLLHKLEAAIAVIGIYFVVGSIGNMYGSPYVEPTPKFVYVLVPILQTFLYGGIVFSIIGLGRTIEQWGFTSDEKSSYSIVPGALLLVMVGAIHGIVIPIESRLDFVLGVLGASAEELYFRVLLITVLLKAFGQSKHKGWWAVLGSSVIFTIPHLFIPEWSAGFALANGLSVGLVLGLTFYLTRCNFFPVVAHVTLNTVQQGGILGGLIFTVVYFALVLGKRALVKRKNRTVPSSIRVSERQ